LPIWKLLFWAGFGCVFAALLNMFIAATVETPIPGLGDLAIKSYRLHNHVFLPLIGFGAALVGIGALTALLKWTVRHD